VMRIAVAGTVVLLWLLGPVAPVLTGGSADGPACCRNESTCPMHRHSAPQGLAFAACRCDDGAAMPAWSRDYGVVQRQAAIQVVATPFAYEQVPASVPCAPSKRPPLPPPRES
jgi:hypothetical protein